MEYEFRTAVQADLSSIVRLLANDVLGAERERLDTHSEQRYQDAFEAIESDKNNLLLVAAEGERLVAVCQVTMIPGLTHQAATRGQIEGVRVASSHRGKGLGRRLMEYAFRVCESNNCRLIQLTSDLRRGDAIEFYRNIGFKYTHAGLKMHLPGPED